MNADKQLQLVTYEQAKRLKALGFDWTVYEYYREETKEWTYPDFSGYDNSAVNDISAPAVALALKWIRDEKKIKCCVEFYGKDEYTYNIYTKTGARIFTHMRVDDHSIADSALLDELLTLLEEKNEYTF